MEVFELGSNSRLTKYVPLNFLSKQRYISINYSKESVSFWFKTKKLQNERSTWDLSDAMSKRKRAIDWENGPTQ